VLSGVRWLSITRWAEAVTDHTSGGVSVYAGLSPLYATVATLLVLLLAVYVAGWRLRGFSLTGDD